MSHHIGSPSILERDYRIPKKNMYNISYLRNFLHLTREIFFKIVGRSIILISLSLFNTCLQVNICFAFYHIYFSFCFSDL